MTQEIEHSPITAQFTAEELEGLFDVVVLNVQETNIAGSSDSIGEPIYTPKPGRQRFIVRSGSLTKKPHKHLAGEENDLERRRHEEAVDGSDGKLQPVGYQRLRYLSPEYVDYTDQDASPADYRNGHRQNGRGLGEARIWQESDSNFTLSDRANVNGWDLVKGGLMVNANGSFGRYVTLEVAESIKAGDINFDAKRVRGTVLYAYHSGFDEVLDKLEVVLDRPEMNTRLDAMIEPAKKAGAAVETLDHLRAEMFATFNFPVVDPNHLENALRVACLMRSKLTALNDIRVAEGQDRISFGLGVATGELETGNMGNDLRTHYATTGKPLLEALRLATEAASGPFDVLVSKDVYEAIDPLLQPNLVAWHGLDQDHEPVYGLKANHYLTPELASSVQA